MPGPIVPVPITAALLHVCHVPSWVTQFLDAPPDALGRQRKRGHRYARVGERIHDRRRHGGERSLAAALRAERAGAVAVLDDDRRHLPRHVLERRHAVVEHRVVHEQAVLEEHLLVERVADALHRRALVLALDQLRVDRPAHVGHGRAAQHRDDAGLGLDARPRRRPRRPPRRPGPRRTSRCPRGARRRARSARRRPGRSGARSAPDTSPGRARARRRSPRAAPGCPRPRASRRGPPAWSSGSRRSSGHRA